MISPYHAKYFAYELTRRRRGGDMERIGQSLFDASIDLNPHQIDAALFALQPPLLKGVVLADGVGLGKTIEAAPVIAQYWAESIEEQKQHPAPVSDSLAVNVRK